MVVGIIMVPTFPKIYEAETLILIQPQKVPTNYVRSIVSTDINTRISTISQQIMSRTNIEKIISQFNLFSGPEFDGMFLEDKVGIVRNNILVDVTSTRQGAEAFSISYKGKSPTMVMNIVNALATYFIDENLKVREDQAIGTSDFIENERMSMLKRLEEVETELRDYRTKYMGELPEQLESNLRILERLQDQLMQREQTLSERKNRLVALETEMKGLQEKALLTGNGGVTVIPEVNEEISNLEKLKSEEKLLLAKYTERHPDVIKVQKLIAGIEDRIKYNQAHQNETASDMKVSSQPNIPPHLGLKNELRGEIVGLETEIIRLKKEIEVYEERVEATPKREQELMSLRRDYDNIQEQYTSLLNRKLEAEISVNMEKKQKGEQFRILDPARLPEKPISPNLDIIFILFMGIGLFSGAGAIFLLEYYNKSFKGSEDIESTLGIPVLAIVPVLADPKSKRRKILGHALTIISIIISIILFTEFTLVTYKDIYKPLEIFGKIIKM